MATSVIGAATSSMSSPAITSLAAGAAARMRQWVKFADSTCASASRRLHRAVSDRKEVLEHQMQEFVLELLAAIVVIAIILIVTDPATRDPDAGESGVRSNP